MTNKNKVLKIGDVAGSGNGMFLRIEVSTDANTTRVTVMQPVLGQGGRRLLPGSAPVIMRPENVLEALRLLEIASVKLDDNWPAAPHKPSSKPRSRIRARSTANKS